MPAGTPLASRAVAPVMLGRCGWAMMNFGLITWGPSYLAQARGFDLKQLGGALAVIFVCGFLGSLTAGAELAVTRARKRAYRDELLRLDQDPDEVLRRAGITD